MFAVIKSGGKQYNSLRYNLKAEKVDAEKKVCSIQKVLLIARKLL